MGVGHAIHLRVAIDPTAAFTASLRRGAMFDVA